jgi:ubiquinone/menaquinone biosynthesis C-methylase UbiE
MGGTSKIDKQTVIDANIKLHTQLAKVYNKDEPHWRPENIATVRKRIEKIISNTGKQNMLDVGCGTGFMEEVVRPLKPDYILAVDVTPAMIEQVDTSGLPKVDLHLGDAAKLPCESNKFDFATAYSFIDHLFDMTSVFKEIHRCLKPAGIFYAGLIPNEDFWSAIHDLAGKETGSPAIDREIRHVVLKDKEMKSTYGVDEATFNQAEYQKNIVGGLSEASLSQTLRECGFSKVEFIYDWFLGQGQINNDPNLKPEDRAKVQSHIDGYLRSNLAVTKHLFKYVSFFATK